MLPLMEMLTQGANGEMIDQIARQYNLNHEQTIQAMEALMPAFSQGLKRNASDPYGVMQFLGALSNGQHASYYDNPSQAFGPAGMQDGNAILGHLFGSKEVSRAVTAQAAQVTGLSQSILKSMLPALAPIILGGLFKQMSGQMSGQASGSTQSRQTDNPFGPLGDIFGQMMGGGPAGTNPLGKMLEEMMGGARTGSRTPSGSANPWGDILGQMMGGARGDDRTKQGQTPNPSDDNPLGRIFDEMLKGAGQAGPAAPRADAEEPPSAPSSRGRGYDELFGDMFETGRKMHKDYQNNVESIFDEFLDGMQKRR